MVVPMSSFFEWKRVGKIKQPYRFFGQSPLAVAGLIRGREFVLLTQESSGPLQSIHTRAPVLIHPTSAVQWIESGSLTPWDLWQLHQEAVSTRVNRASEQGPDLWDPIGPTDLFEYGRTQE